MGYKQVGKTVNSTTETASVEEYSTAIADKTHLANLITTLKSELASTNALLKNKEKDYHEAKEQLKRFKGDLSDAYKQVEILEKQCENYRLNVSDILEIVCEFSLIKLYFVLLRSNIWKIRLKHIPKQYSDLKNIRPH